MSSVVLHSSLVTHVLAERWTCDDCSQLVEFYGWCGFLVVQKSWPVRRRCCWSVDWLPRRDTVTAGSVQSAPVGTTTVTVAVVWRWSVERGCSCDAADWLTSRTAQRVYDAWLCTQLVMPVHSRDTSSSVYNIKLCLHYQNNIKRRRIVKATAQSVAHRFSPVVKLGGDPGDLRSPTSDLRSPTSDDRPHLWSFLFFLS